MTNPIGAGAATAAGLAILAFTAGCEPVERDANPAAASPSTVNGSTASTATHPSFLYGRVTTVDGATHEGRLRFGGDEEAFWGDYFNGVKDGNPWVDHVSSEQLREELGAIEIFGFEIGVRGRPAGLDRPFMARFGDVARLEARRRDLLVTLKSGTVVHLDRYAADDFADGVRIWDDAGRVIELGERRIRSIDLLPPPTAGAAGPPRLHGMVRTNDGVFTGFLQWDRKEGVGLDELEGHDAGGDLIRVPFAAIRSIARRSPSSAEVTLLDGRELVLSGTREVGQGNGGVYVDDARYGRVLVSWEAFQRVDLSAADASGPVYGDYPAGQALEGRVTTRDGRRLAGRLVFDLDESETTETLDAPSGGVDYTIPFGLVASIVPAADGEPGVGRARITLWSGEELLLEPAGDLADGNAGMVVFVDGAERPEYVPWSDVARIELERPQAMYPAPRPGASRH